MRNAESKLTPVVNHLQLRPKFTGNKNFRQPDFFGRISSR
jgi:hypothetical protein